jgi:hypothetical protein
MDELFVSAEYTRPQPTDSCSMANKKHTGVDGLGSSVLDGLDDVGDVEVGLGSRSGTLESSEWCIFKERKWRVRLATTLRYPMRGAEICPGCVCDQQRSVCRRIHEYHHPGWCRSSFFVY